jgi:hypothetical protein
MEKGGKDRIRSGAVVTLHFRPRSDLDAVDDPLRQDLSALELTGRCLWTACDETVTVERLVTEDWRHFGRHRSYDLGAYFPLPSDAGEEIDIEGLAHDDGYLWITGSHSLKRKKPKRHEKDRRQALDRLTRIEREANRYFLGRVPLVAGTEEGIFEPIEPGASPTADGRTAACLAMHGGSNALADVLKDDIHIGPFMAVPCKENGFDIEGIAARGERVFLGLRGPVLRGWALVLELQVETQGGTLSLRPIGEDGVGYRKHFLDLDGLGIRDLSFDGDRLLLLAGPTMDLDGPVAVYAWPGALSAEDEQVIPHDELEKVFDVPYGHGVDHAEGIALKRPAEGGGPAHLLVVFDSPAPGRLHDDGVSIDADLYLCAAKGA